MCVCVLANYIKSVHFLFLLSTSFFSCDSIRREEDSTAEEEEEEEADIQVAIAHTHTL